MIRLICFLRLLFKKKKKKKNQAPKLIPIVGSGASREGTRDDPARSSSVSRCEGRTVSTCMHLRFQLPLCYSQLHESCLPLFSHYSKSGSRTTQASFTLTSFFVLNILASSCEATCDKSTKLLRLYAKDRMPNTEQDLYAKMLIRSLFLSKI